MLNFLWTVAIVVISVIAVRLLLKTMRRQSAGRFFLLNDRAAWQQKWNEIEELLNGGTTHWKVAIIDADQLVDRVTKSMQLPGVDLGERVRFLVRTRTELQYIYEARRVRNRLVHEHDYVLDSATARRVIKIYQRLLLDLGVL